MSLRSRMIVAELPLLASLGLASPTRAVDFDWNEPGGGVFTSAPNWQPFNPAPPFLLGPGAVDDAVHFDLGTVSEDRYTVSQVSGQNHELLIHNDSLTLEFSGDYSLPNTQAGVPNFVVGVGDGDAADVILTGHGGAIFQPLRTFLAASPASSGMVAVRGSDWLLDVGHQIMVGWYGTGSLTIEDGADVVSFAPLIGTFDGSIGTAIVRGAGSSWASGGQMSVAVSGTATLTIEDGGSVTSGGASIGNSSGGSGSVSVRGPSSWNMGGTVFLGYGGTGTLAIEDGGSATAQQAWLGGWADEGFGTGTIDVRGRGASFVVGEDCGGCGGDLTVGVSNSGALTIEDGGRVSNVGGWLGLNPGSTGIAFVRGSSRWDNAETLFVGDEGTGTVVIEAGGRVASADGWLGVNPDAMGTASVRDTGSSWDSGHLFVGSQGAGHLSIEDGGNVSNTSAWMGHLFTGSGTVTVRGVGSTWDVAGALHVGYAGAGTLVIDAGGDVTSRSAEIAATFGSTSSATVAGAGSTWESGTLHVGSAGTGALTISDGGIVISADATIGDRGTIPVDGANAVWLLDGSLAMEDEAQAGTLGIGIAGLTAHGLVSVAGDAQLAGALELTLKDGFVPHAHDSFTLLTSGGGISGGFDNVANGHRLDTADGHGSFLVHYGSTSAANPDHIVLTGYLVPEPGVLLTTLAASTALLSMRWRSRKVAGSRAAPGSPQSHSSGPRSRRRART
jgi:T5SS/PEP-CTERM-associated repeat protein